MTLDKNTISGIFGKKIIDNMREQKIFVFGKSGMLGRYVYTYLKEKGYNVVGVGRADVDASNYSTMLHKYVENNMSEGDVVIR